MRASRVLFTIAGVQMLVLGLGFGMPASIGAAHLARTGSIWYLWGFPTHQAVAIFTAMGIRTSVPLILGFVVACAILVVAGILLFVTPGVGAVLTLVSIPVAAVFWLGFDLPFAPPGGIVTVVLIVVALILRRRAR